MEKVGILEILDSIRNIYSFLGQPDNLPEGKAIIAVSCNWYDVHGKDRVIKKLYSKFNPEKLLLASGIGRFSSKKAREMGGESYELKERLVERGLPEEILNTYTGGKFTTDNIDWILASAKDTKYNNIIVPEEAYLAQRVRATFDARKTKFHPDAKVSVIPVHNLEEYLSLHKTDAAYFYLVGEGDRLRDYSDPQRPGPNVFSHESAFRGAEKFGGVEKLTDDFEKIRNTYDNKKLKEILDSDKALDYFAPRETFLILLKNSILNPKIL